MNDNKWMFEAKRQDNGEIVSGSLVYTALGVFIAEELPDGINRVKGMMVEINDLIKYTSINPSTIKPLFTTDKPDAWLFENVDNLAFRDVSPEEREVICFSVDNNPDDCEVLSSDGCWKPTSYTHVVFDCIYRVKTNKYTLCDAMIDLTKLTGQHTKSPEALILFKLAKDNGLVNNDE